MKRLTVFAAAWMLSSYSHSALTQSQIKQVKTGVDQMQNTLARMERLAVVAGNALAAGNTFTLNLSTVPYPLTAQQQQDIVNYYQDLKAQLQAELLALP